MIIFIGLNANAQEYGVIDTIRVSEWLQKVQAYCDTVMIFEEVPGIGDPPARGFVRRGKNAQWDSVELVSGAQAQAPMKGCVMAGSQNDTDPEMYWIMRDASTTRIDSTGRPGDRISVSPLKRIRVHPANTHKIYVQFEYTKFDGTYTATYVTNDDGQTWKEINPPIYPSDVARGHTLGFDYNFPNRLYIWIDGSGLLNPDAPAHYHYTDDDGETFYISQDANDPMREAGYGIWSKGGGIYANDFGICIATDSIGLPPGSSTQSICPPWLDNVRKSLLPNYDPSTQKLRYSFYGRSQTTGTIDGLAFHPERPETFAVEFRFDTLVGNVWHPRNFVAATSDFGNTWQWILKVNDLRMSSYNGVRAIIIDPLDNGVYCSYQLLLRDSTTGRTTYLNSYTIKSTPRTTSVAGDAPERTDKDSRVFPNPVSIGTPITIALTATDEAFGEAISRVTCSTLDGRILESSSTSTLYTQNLAPGVYSLAVFWGGNQEHHLVVVTR
ncbi:MAG: hypothetical protein IPI29_11285 [Ignavibacteria bacterium]|nr:hypothetical protein [Ignavibacteria bacterium]